MLERSIFGHEGEAAEEVVYVNWLTMVRAGLLGLEFYTPESKSWRQVSRTLSSKLQLHSTINYNKILVHILFIYLAATI